MKPTNKMTLEELLNEKEVLEKQQKLTSRDKQRLKKITNEISKNNSKISVSDSFTNESMKSELKLEYVFIKDIIMPDYDDRSGIDKEKIESLAKSIKEHGLIQYPVLKDLGNGQFEKKVGRRRILATKSNGEEKILVKILPTGLTEEQEDFIIWDENNQREDLNLYDKVRFHLRFICRRFNLKFEKNAIALINNCHYYKKSKDIVAEENQKKVEELEALLHELGSYKTVSSLMNNLQVLNFDEKVLEAMKENKISYKLAYLLNKSIALLEEIYKDDKDEVQRIINYIIKEEFSVTEAEKYINNIIKNNTVKDEVEVKFNKTVKRLNRKINSFKEEDREKVITAIDTFLKDLNKLPK